MRIAEPPRYQRPLRCLITVSCFAVIGSRLSIGITGKEKVQGTDIGARRTVTHEFH